MLQALNHLRFALATLAFQGWKYKLIQSHEKALKVEMAIKRGRAHFIARAFDSWHIYALLWQKRRRDCKGEQKSFPPVSISGLKEPTTTSINGWTHQHAQIGAYAGFAKTKRTKCLRAILESWHNDVIEACRAQIIMSEVNPVLSSETNINRPHLSKRMMFFVGIATYAHRAVVR